MRVAVLLVAVVGCRTAATPPLAPAASYETHLAAAARLEDDATFHSEAAEVARQRGPTYECETHPESEQTTSGTERLNGTRVCDDVAASDERRHRREADRLRAEAGHQRGLARSLLDADRRACAGLGLEVLRDPPLRRHAARARVEAVAGGARITLAGPGVDGGQVRRELGCHRARAALMGHDPAYMPSEPAVVAGARLTIEVSVAAVVITIVSDDAGSAETILRRAEALVGR